jgi:hypothetical protein
MDLSTYNSWRVIMKQLSNFSMMTLTIVVLILTALTLIFVPGMGEATQLYNRDLDKIQKTYFFRHDTGMFLDFLECDVRHWRINEFDSQGGGIADITDQWGIWKGRDSWEIVVPYTVKPMGMTKEKKFVFVHDTFSLHDKHPWFIQELLPDGTLGAITHSGKFNNRYEAMGAYTLGGRTFLVGHEFHGGDENIFFIQELLYSGRLGSNETDHEEWEREWDQIHPYTVKNSAGEERAFLFAHDHQGHYWWIRQLTADGRLLPQVDDDDCHGDWNDSYETMCTHIVDGTTLLFGHDHGGDRRFFTQELTYNGELGDYELDNGEWDDSWEFAVPYTVKNPDTGAERHYLLAEDDYDHNGYNWWIRRWTVNDLYDNPSQAMQWSDSYEAMFAFTGSTYELIPEDPCQPTYEEMNWRENWMGILGNRLYHRKITDIVVPGTHNSATSKINSNSEMSPDTDTLPEWLFLLEETRTIVAGYSKAQSKYVAEQLKSGIRYLDLRICFNSDDDELWTCHGMYSDKLDDVIQEISDFVISHPKEIVILDFQKFYEVGNDKHCLLITQLLDTFGDLIVPEPSVDKMNYTVGELWDEGKQVIILYRKDFVSLDCTNNNQIGLLWKGDFIRSPWPDKDNVTDLKDYLQNKINEGLNKTKEIDGNEYDIFYGLQGIIFPEMPGSIDEGFEFIKDAFKKFHVDKWNKNSLTPGSYTSWVWNDWYSEPINIIMTDYFHLTGLVDAAIEINYNCLNEADADGDGTGNSCDTCTDTDGDGYGNPGFPANTCPEDNCPDVINPDQTDSDRDGTGDACDTCTDTDGDGYGNPGFENNTCPEDNCPDLSNTDQNDADSDGLGDVCDPCDGRSIDGSVSPSPGIIQRCNPPGMVQVTIDVSDLETHNPDTTIKITSVAIEEYDKKGNYIYEENKYEPDFEITGDLTVNLRAERSPTSTGRVYVIGVTSSDCSGDYPFTTEVHVPRSRRTKR